jgi:hypothetical protein
MPIDLRPLLLSQFEASLAMLRECLVKCPPDQWNSPVGKYPFWQVAYHVLCFVDCYLSPSNDDWHPRAGDPRGGTFHPAGRAELDEEYPSRRFSQQELIAYCDLCHEKARVVLAGDLAPPHLAPPDATPETDESLAMPSGFAHLPFTRAELHLYNVRHAQHHTGQLTAFLRRVSVDTGWVKKGWKRSES